MKKYDAFTYFNESDMVRLRLKELGDAVDFFIVVEASETFTGMPKPYYFDKIKLTPDLSKKIIRVKTNFPHSDMNAWDREVFQRNQITIGLSEAEPDDVVIISDVDEIPNMDTVEGLGIPQLPLRLDVKQYFWNFNWQVPDHCNEGARPIFAKVKDVIQRTPQDLRANGDLATVPNGGWHFSFFGSEQSIVNKIESFAHTEYNSVEYKELESIKYRIDNGIDPFDRFPLKYTKIDSTYPKTIIKESNC